MTVNMRVLKALSIILLAHLASLSFAIPISPDSTTSTSALFPRDKFCANAPNTVAGSPLAALQPRADPSLQPRVLPNSRLWCAYGSSTYVSVTWGYSIAGSTVSHILTATYNAINAHIARAGDHLVPHGFFSYYDYGLEIRMVNTNNHQQTWGVMNAGLAAVMQFMERSGNGPGAVAWKVFDGENLVGAGFLQEDRGPS